MAEMTHTFLHACPWCDLEYEITPEKEIAHLEICPMFQALPVAEVRDGKTYVAWPYAPNILVERVRVQ